jgi:hypothetical protein
MRTPGPKVRTLDDQLVVRLSDLRATPDRR